MNFQSNSLSATHAREQGAAVVELALLLPILVAFLVFPYFFARYYWHYSVAERAAQDAARYLSSISVQEMRSATLAPASAALASQIATAEIAELNPGNAAPAISVTCGPDPCFGVGGAALPQTVRVHIAMNMFDLSDVVDAGRYGMPIRVDAEMRYVGN